MKEEKKAVKKKYEKKEKEERKKLKKKIKRKERKKKKAIHHTYQTTMKRGKQCNVRRKGGKEKGKGVQCGEEGKEETLAGHLLFAFKTNVLDTRNKYGYGKEKKM